MKEIKATRMESFEPRQLADAVMSSLESQPEKPEQVYICCRKHGQRIFWKVYQGSDWRRLLESAFREVRSKGATTIEVGLAHNRRAVKNPARTLGEVRKGIRGMRLTARDVTQTLFPSAMIATNAGFKKSYEEFASSYKSGAVSIEAFDVFQFMVLIDEDVRLAPLYRGNQVVEEEEVTLENTEGLAALMTQWMTTNVDSEGRLTYKYWPSRGEYSGANNMIRQFMGTLCLFQCAEFYEDESIRDKAELNLAYDMQHFYVEKDGVGYIDESGKAKLGAAALAALAVLREGSGRFAEQEQRLFDLTLSLQQDDGSFFTYYKPHGSRENTNFYPGECLLYWAHVLEREWSKALYDGFMRSFEYYRAWHLANRNPAFVPWHTQAYYKLYQLKKDRRLKDWIFEMNDWLLPFQQWDGLAAADLRGRFYDPNKPYGPPHASSTGVYIEGLIDAFKLAVDFEDSQRASAYANAIKRAIRDVMQLQFSNDIDMYYISKRERVLGGIRTTEYNNEIRVDNVQHNLMGILKVIGDEEFIW